MKKHPVLLLASFILGLAGVVLLPAKESPAPKAPATDKPVAAGKATAADKMPDLLQDDTPVGDGRAPSVTSYADVLEGIRPAVVSIYSTKVVRQRIPRALRPYFGNSPDQERKLSGLGSGVIVSSNGYILTNNHVVEEADELEVQLADE